MAGPVAFTDQTPLFDPAKGPMGHAFGLPWPRYERRDWSGVSDEEIRAELEQKLKFEDCARQDPIQYGWTLESWREVMEEWNKYDVHAIFGGNRSSKSSLCARIMVYLLLTIPEARLRCYQVNDEKSASEQMAFIWEALPDRYKNLTRKKGLAHAVQYTQKTGFTSGKLIVPPVAGYRRGGEMIFGTYQQYRNDPQVVEGWWAHAVWCDEEVPVKMYERLLTRLFDAHGRMLLSFTTIQGWSALVGEILGKTRTLRKRLAPLLRREIPVAQESLSRRGTRIHYFWTEDNPFIPADIAEKMAGRPKEEILSVMYGIPTRSTQCRFPKFDDSVHVVRHEDLPWRKAGDDQERVYTDYVAIDPSGSKPWFMVWLRVDPSGNVFAVREWPDEGYGVWAESGEQASSKAGPAQRPLGFSTGDYVELMQQCEAEDGLKIFERVIDPRLAVAETPTKEGSTSILSELEAALTEADDECPRVMCAPGLPIDHGLQLINDRLRYDETKPVSATNAPRFYVSDRCSNLIWCLKNYTALGGKDEAAKDPIDCVRYVLENGADFVEPGEASAQRGTFSY